MTVRILIGSTVRQKPAILREFLQSLMELDRNEISCDYIYFDNNDLPESSQLLKTFVVQGANTMLAGEPPESIYQCTNVTHNWTPSLIWKVAAYKDLLLQYALDNNYSHIFLVDSDLVLHPSTLKQLLTANVDIVSEIFWTEWTPGSGPLPQVWMCGQYGFTSGLSPGGDQNKYREETLKTIYSLQKPGLYEVGGLGACTLISRRAIEAGVRFAQIGNVDYYGEDRHLCIRAAVLGFKLYVDTHLPAFHIYRESDLQSVLEFKENCRKDNHMQKYYIR